MALHINCDICEEELNEPGAIILDPPDSDDCVYKMHICKKCWHRLMRMMSTLRKGD